MRKYRLRVGLDVDDILYDCNAYALHLLNERYPDEPSQSILDVTEWGNCGARGEERLALFADPAFVRSQPLFPGAQTFVQKLNGLADVFFVTAVPPQCMSARAERLCADFPEVPTENIVIGTRKDIVALDILLDDAPHNIAASRAAYPVLFRKPWNVGLSGLLSVNDYDDFLHLCKMVRSSFTEKLPDVCGGGVVCLVGPSGSGKNEIARTLLQDARFEKPMTTTTRPRRPEEGADAYRFIDEEQFLREREAGAFVETTVYSRYFFGTSLSEITPILERGHAAVIPIDICGALTLKNRYRNRAVLVFTDRPREAVLTEILSRPIPDEDKVRRILSMEYEYRNEQFCDLSLSVGRDPGEAAENLRRLLRK